MDGSALASEMEGARPPGPRPLKGVICVFQGTCHPWQYPGPYPWVVVGSSSTRSSPALQREVTCPLFTAGDVQPPPPRAVSDGPGRGEPQTGLRNSSRFVLSLVRLPSFRLVHGDLQPGLDRSLRKGLRDSPRSLEREPGSPGGRLTRVSELAVPRQGGSQSPPAHAVVPPLGMAFRCDC